MTSSDRKMDRTLSSLPSLAPDYSAWPAIDARLNQQDRQRRRKRLMGYGFSGVAASLMVALGVASQLTAKPQKAVDLQSTVDAAIRDALPQPMFTGLNLSQPRPELRALLVSAKPRGEVSAVPIGDSRRPLQVQAPADSEASGRENGSGPKKNLINEF